MYLSQEALSNLKKYKYQSGEYSFMDNVLTPFWNKIVNYLPLWLAPNLVTFIGLLITIISCLLYLPSDLTLTESFHPFYYLFSAISLFIYQTLDAIDGKQARRTGNSSPLGLIFDHGCDCFSVGIQVLIFCRILQTGDNAIAAYMLIST
jgi:phosphatidylglycerophosphate synthase